MQYVPKHGAETLQAVLKDVNSVDQSDLDDIYIDSHCVPFARDSWFSQLWIYTTFTLSIRETANTQCEPTLHYMRMYAHKFQL